MSQKKLVAHGLCYFLVRFMEIILIEGGSLLGLCSPDESSEVHMSTGKEALLCGKWPRKLPGGPFLQDY